MLRPEMSHGIESGLSGPGRPDHPATFAATRPLGPGEQLTIVTALPKGMVAMPTPILGPKPGPPTWWEQLGFNAGSTVWAAVLLLVGLPSLPVSIGGAGSSDGGAGWSGFDAGSAGGGGGGGGGGSW
jgi:hypothetical protein